MGAFNWLRSRTFEAPGNWLGRSRALASVLLFMSAVAFSYSLWPPTAGTPRQADALVGLITLVVAVVLLVLGERLPNVVGVDIPAVVAWGCVAFMAATRPTPQGQLLFGYPLVALGVVLALYLTWVRAAAHLAAMLGTFLAAVILVGERAAFFYLLIAGSTVIVTAVTIGRLRVIRDRLTNELTRLSLVDPLTGALNRRGLEADARVVRALAARSGQSITVVMIDLDGFKEYNDARGHAAGDRLLQAIVQEWRPVLRGGDLIARLGGDEFIFVLTGVDTETAMRLLERMRAESCAQWSSGVAEWHENEDLESVLNMADVAMYRDKQERGGAR